MMARRLIAYEVVNKANPSLIDRIDLPDGDPRGLVMDGLLRQMNVNEWFVRDVYAKPGTPTSSRPSPNRRSAELGKAYRYDDRLEL